MASTDLIIKLRAPTRCVIHCRQKSYFVEPEGSISQIRGQANSAVKTIIEYAKGDPRALDIVVDYGNPGHKNCEVVGYKIGRRVSSFSVEASWIHETVDRWKRSPFPHIVCPFKIAIACTK